MVATQLPVLTQTRTGKAFQCQLTLPVITSDVVPSDQLELDFSDVFGPLPVQESLELNNGVCDSLIPQADAIEIVYNDPEVIFNRSHSLVGPCNRVSQSINLSKLAIHETEDGATHEDKRISFNAGDDCVNPETIGLEDFELMKVVGQGAFAKVYQVRQRGTGEIFAMKVMRKDRIMEKNHAEYMKEERNILTKIDHPFIIRLRYSFQTKYRLYLVLDFLNGGHLFFQLFHQGLFREDLARIYAAEIISAVSHLHANGIMHRDLKPENILLDADGHVRLTDFGLAKQFEENTRSNSMCGTLEYMSPEIILKNGHDKAADWWSVGILLFEMLTGKPPFVGNRQKVQQKIVKDKVKLPAYLSSEAHSLLKALLQKDPNRRLGTGLKGSEEIKGHKWFSSINWKKLEAREIQPSFRPQVAGKHCIANFDKSWTDMSLLDSPVSSPRADENVFNGFAYVRPAATLQNSHSS